MSAGLPDWAEKWDGRKHCRNCKARLVVVQDYTGRYRYGICSSSGWPDHECEARSEDEKEEEEEPC